MNSIETLNILVVDDDPLNLRVIIQSLTSAGFATAGVFNGLEAMEILDTRKFDAVVSDIQMPFMDGVELLQKIRMRFPPIPVLLMTGLISDEIRDAASRWGAVALFQKPVNRKELILAIRMSQHEATRLDCAF